MSVDCVDASDASPIAFVNDGVEEVSVYFIVDASSSGEAGTFTLEWWFYTVGQGRFLNTYTPLTDSNIKTAAQLWVSDQASATSTYGPVHLWDLSQVTTLENVWCGWDPVSGANQCGSAYVAMRSFNGEISMWDVSKVASMYRSKLIHIFENDLT